MQINESSDALDRWRGLVESNMTGATDAEDLEVDSTYRFNFLLVLVAEFSDILTGNLAVGNVHILRRNVNMFE